jgi:anti-sigma factor RsiW
MEHTMHQTDHIAGEDLVAYADGELRGADLARVQTHLRICEECQRRLAADAEVERLIREHLPIIDNPVRRAVLKARIAAEAARRARPWWRKRVVWIGVAIMAALLALLPLLQ